jgi:phosphatidylglycerophosphate synthase
MWLAHALTLVRLPIALAIVATWGHHAWTIGLIALAAVTDAADGNVARYMQRRGRTQPDIGGWLDPLVDKLFIVIVLATLYAHTGDDVLVALIALREILLIPVVVTLFLLGVTASHAKAAALGKVATIAQLAALAVAVVDPWRALPIALLAAITGLGAVIYYLVREVRTPAAAPT